MPKPTQVSNFLMAQKSPKSKRKKGVLEYALELVLNVAEDTKNKDLNKLCTESELKKTKYGNNKPNKEEQRLDTQARALYQAEQLIAKAIDTIEKTF